MKMRLTLAIAVAWLLLQSGGAFAQNCTAGATNCSTDTVNQGKITAAMTDPTFGNRVYGLWTQYCESVYGAPSDPNYQYKNAFCLSMVAGKVPANVLTSSVLTAITEGQLLSSTCTVPPGTAGSAAGCIVDADINQAISNAMTVSDAAASTTMTASAQSTSGTVASGTGIVVGQQIFCPGVPNTSIVISVTGTTVLMSLPTTAVLSATPCQFNLYGGLVTRPWG